MSRNALIAAILSLLFHAGVAFSGHFLKEKPAAPAADDTVPTIALDLPPPPEPEEPETVENVSSDTPAEVADIAPPMQNDLPTAPIDAPFTQRPQPPAPPGISRPTGGPIPIPVGPPRTGSGGSGLGKIFDLGDLDQKPEPRVRPLPVYPFEMRRSGLKGEVIVRFIVDTQGNTRDAEIVRSSHPGFEQAALDAVLKWKFKPGKKAGAPQNTRVSQLLTFTLNAE